MPKILCNEANIRKKQKAFKELRTTNHHPCKVKLFTKHPYTYGGTMPLITEIKPPILSEFGLTLAGF